MNLLRPAIRVIQKISLFLDSQILRDFVMLSTMANRPVDPLCHADLPLLRFPRSTIDPVNINS
jgi:hypothetical protein